MRKALQGEATKLDMLIESVEHRGDFSISDEDFEKLSAWYSHTLKKENCLETQIIFCIYVKRCNHSNILPDRDIKSHGYIDIYTRLKQTVN